MKSIKNKDSYLIKKSARKVNLSEEEAMDLIDKIRTKLPINKSIKNRIVISLKDQDKWYKAGWDDGRRDLLKKQIEWIEKIKKEIDMSQFGFQGFDEGYNQAISDVISHFKELISLKVLILV